MLKLLAVITLLLLNACAPAAGTQEAPVVVSSTVTTINSNTVKFVWNDEFDNAIMKNAPESILAVSPSVMVNYCPKWKSLSLDEKKRFYADMFYGVAYYESKYNPLVLYWEKGLGKDSITGQLVISEGLLQLSYGDDSWAHCGFDYAKDKAFHLDDLAHRNGKTSWVSLHPEKTTLDPLRNVVCGMKIVEFKMKKYPGREFKDLLQPYWSTVRKLTPQIIGIMKSRKSKCF